MKAQLGDKLAAGIRDAKQQRPPAATATPPAAPAEKRQEVKPMPSRRVWPD